MKDSLVVAALRAASQHLSAADDRTLAEWQEEDPPEVVRLGELGRAYADGIDAIDAEEKFGVMAQLEEFMASNGRASNLVATGFNEAYANVVSDGTLSDRALAGLGPRAREYLRAYVLGP